MAHESTTTSLVQFRGFIATAKPGERAVYHTGFLLDDRKIDHKKKPRDAGRARALDMLADHVYLMADVGLVTLTQRRRGDGTSDYLATRTSRKGTTI